MNVISALQPSKENVCRSGMNHGHHTLFIPCSRRNDVSDFSWTSSFMKSSYLSTPGSYIPSTAICCMEGVGELEQRHSDTASDEVSRCRNSRVFARLRLGRKPKDTWELKTEIKKTWHRNVFAATELSRFMTHSRSTEWHMHTYMHRRCSSALCEQSDEWWNESKQCYPGTRVSRLLFHGFS